MFQKPKDTLQLIVHESDIPFVDRGTLIPSAFTPQKVASDAPVSRRVVVSWPAAGRVAIVAITALMLFFVGTAGVQMLGETNQQMAAPIGTVVDPNTLQVTPLEYGPQVALAQPSFYTETRAAFITDEVTFIELDLTRNQLRYFIDGIIMQTAEIIGQPAEGSWWETPSGLYKVSDTEDVFFSSISHADYPWAVRFEENFMIHGAPTYPDGSAVVDDFMGGGVELSNAAARQLFEEVRVGTPVLVHLEKAAPEIFVYEPPVPDVSAPHYFVADIESGAVLAATDIDDQASIASLTKLMTALVAVEELDLDRRVYVASPTFVTSLVPRLESRSSVSMYSLLQLLLVESSNEAAEVIAAEMGRAEFIDAMNAKARQLGMLNTTFADPSGLDAGNVSTIGDLYRLTQYIEQNRSFIIGITKDVNLPTAYSGGDFSGLINFNEVEDVTGYVGGKVGETRAAGQTSISLHEIDIKGSTRTVTVIVLGSTQRTADVQTLVSFVEEHFGG